MRTVVAATVTMDDLKKYFKGEGWQLKGLTDSYLEASSKFYDVSLSSKSFMYHVRVEALDD